MIDIIKEKQPEEVEKINKLASPKISKKDIEYCMRHDAFKRSKGGAIRQIRR